MIDSSSKDGLVKLWDLDTQHCFQTIVSHHKEVWSLELVGGPSLGEGVVSLPRLVTASGDNRVRLFRLSVDNPGGDDVGSLDQVGDDIIMHSHSLATSVCNINEVSSLDISFLQ